jgi:REP element-mobilizing transposase RayT
MVFSDHAEATEFVDVITAVKRLHGFLILAWSLMGNHCHVAV